MLLTKTPEVRRQESLVAELRDAILTCQIAPGTRLGQEELAERFGVSRIPLREALRTLEGEGLVQSEPNRGSVCRPLDPKDLSDLYAVRLSLEKLAIESAAARFVDLQGLVAERRTQAIAAAQRGDLATLLKLDFAFHADLAAASGNAHLTQALAASCSQIMRAMHFFLTLERVPEGVWEEHAAIARAVAYGDSAAALELIERHLVESRNVILRRLKEAHA